MSERVIRVFTGEMPSKLNNYKVSLFEQKHLKGFLSGMNLFQYKRKQGINTLLQEPMYFSVQYKYMTESEYYEFLKNRTL